jgi:hypothetical protein
MLACTAAGDGVETGILSVTTIGGALKRWESSGRLPSASAAAGVSSPTQSPSQSSIAGRAVPALPGATMLRQKCQSVSQCIRFSLVEFIDFTGGSDPVLTEGWWVWVWVCIQAEVIQY